MGMPRIRMLHPAGRESDHNLSLAAKELEKSGITVLYEPDPGPRDWPWTAGDVGTRSQRLNQALLEPDSDMVLCARGGYGSSDLLPHLDWEALAGRPPKPLIGFSDISSLHSALRARLGWHGIHGPMPDTDYWETGDAAALAGVLGQGNQAGTLTVQPLREGDDGPEGWLFGGCFTVLTNLIGTPWLPPLKDAILLLEDTGETPPRLLRALNQWQQSGALDDVAAIVLGRFSGCAVAATGVDEEGLLTAMASRLDLPVYHCRQFGHCRPNHPWIIGARATIGKQQLNWQTEGNLW